MLTIYTSILLPNHLQEVPFGLQINKIKPESGVFLFYDEQGLALGKAGEKGKVQVDFAAGASQYRRIKGGGELIAKAVNHTQNPIVWDATGGLGRDSWVLASLGLNVIVFEQNPSAYLLLLDGLKRVEQTELSIIASRITLHYAQAVIGMQTLIQQKARQPDVIYLDPMYPGRQKSAAVKKEMAYFHELVGLATYEDEWQLLQAAKNIAKKRIVVKRPRLGEFLCGEKPSYQYIGKSTRFDVYLPHHIVVPTQMR